MAVKGLMDLALDEAGFKRRVQFAMFSVAKDKAQGGVAPGSNDEAFIDGILNGLVNITLMAVGIVVINANAGTVNDAAIKGDVSALWPFFAAAWKRGNA